MSENCVKVLTSKTFDVMVEEGGSGDWRAREDRIRKCRWLVAVRNRHSDWGTGQEDHGTGFLIGRITGVKPSRTVGRQVITFDEYAEIDVPGAWQGQRFPVAYCDIADLGIDLDSLKWKKFPSNSGEVGEGRKAVDRIGDPPKVVIQRAKQMIAHALSIDPASVRISVEV